MVYTKAISRSRGAGRLHAFATRLGIVAVLAMTVLPGVAAASPPDVPGAVTRSLASGQAATAVANGKLVFVRNNDIWTMNSDGTGAANLTPTPGANDVAPSVSSDGTKIAFQTDQFSGGTPDIAMMNLDGTGLVRVVLGAREPTWAA